MSTRRNRVSFNADGPFLARKNFSILDIDIRAGETYLSEVLRYGLHDRRIEQLYASKHIDMAEPGTKAHTLKSAAGAHPLDRDGDGGKGGSLTDVEKQALKDAGLSEKDWLKLPEPERSAALADATRAASAPPETSGAGGNDASGGGEGAETGQEAATGAAGAGDGANGAAGADSAAGGPPAAYKNYGFGRYWAINAAGESFGPKLGKTDATAFAARDGVPLLGMTESLPGQ